MFADFNLIKTFLTVVKTKSFSKTSQTLKISQPAVTLQMKKLEQAVGVTLLLRKKNGILLTKEGEKFKSLCDKMEKNIYIFNEEIVNLKDTNSKIRVATTPTLQDLLPLYLDDIEKTLNKKIDIKVQDDSELSKCVEEARCDIALGSKICFGKNVLAKECFKYNFVLISNKKRDSVLKAEEIKNLNFIKDETKSMDFIFDKFPVKYDELNTAFTVSGTMAVLNIMYYSQNEYYAFIPEYLMQKSINDGIVYKVDMDNISLQRSVYAGTLRENEVFLDQFIKTVKP